MDNEISPPSSHWYYWTEQQVRPEHQRTLLSTPPPLSFLVAQSSWIVPRLLSPRLENNRVFLLILSIFFSLRPHFYLR